MYSTGGRGFYSNFNSSASAYMLMYRRLDPQLNINECTKKDLPKKLTAELEAERAAARCVSCAANDGTLVSAVHLLIVGVRRRRAKEEREEAERERRLNE